MKISSAEIQVKYALRRIHDGDYIDWAVGCLEDGLDSKSLRILAGFERFASPFECEEYFLKARTELALPEPTLEEALCTYATHIAQQILQPESDFHKLVGMVSALC